MKYSKEITKAMTWLGEQDKSIFVGQSVRYDGQALFKTFKDVPMDKRVEMPVVEEFQMGFCIGLSLQGYVPISFYPRMDFLILAMNQLVNHLDKIPLMSGFKPKVIIRTAVGATKPLNAGHQHTQDHTEALKLMLKTVDVVTIDRAETAFGKYQQAWESPRSSLMIECMSLHHNA
jgi:pyruvate/2-oxoglutarate/acetoin dehydrogenase E1 component